MESLRIDSRGELAPLNAVGISPDWRVREFPLLEVRQCDCASASFDFAWTYSIRNKVEPLAERFQNNDARSVPNAEDDDPSTNAATAAWLSIHRTQVRCFPLVHLGARKTMSMAAPAHSSKMKIGDSPGMLLTMSMNQLGRWAGAAVLVSPVYTAAIRPRP